MSLNADSSSGTPAIRTRILSKPEDWDQWLYIIEERARHHDIWDLCDPSKETEPSLPQRPGAYPTVQTISQDKTLPSQLTETERQDLVALKDDYKEASRAYDRYLIGARDVTKYLLETVTNKNLTYIERSCPSVYLKLKALKARLAPTNRARELELSNRYNALKKAPRSR